MNELISDKAVFRTALATQDLLNIFRICFDKGFGISSVTSGVCLQIFYSGLITFFRMPWPGIFLEIFWLCLNKVFQDVYHGLVPPSVLRITEGGGGEEIDRCINLKVAYNLQLNLVLLLSLYWRQHLVRSFVWKRRTDAHVLANLLLTLMCTITLKANMTEICSRPDRFRNLFLYCLVLAGTSLVLFGIRWGESGIFLVLSEVWYCLVLARTSLVLFGIRWGESGIFWYWLKFGIGRGQFVNVWYWQGPALYCLVMDRAILVMFGNW